MYRGETTNLVQPRSENKWGENAEENNEMDTDENKKKGYTTEIIGWRHKKVNEC